MFFVGGRNHWPVLSVAYPQEGKNGQIPEDKRLRGRAWRRSEKVPPAAAVPTDRTNGDPEPLCPGRPPEPTEEGLFPDEVGAGGGGRLACPAAPIPTDRRGTDPTHDKPWGARARSDWPELRDAAAKLQPGRARLMDRLYSNCCGGRAMLWADFGQCHWQRCQ